MRVFVVCLQSIILILLSQSVFSQNRAQELSQLLKTPNSDHVFVVAHRGDWRHAPENSLRAIQNCIDMGVDMVELDVRQTKDGVFVLMHDDSIDRTTNGTGKVYELTWAELSRYYLKDPLQIVTKHKIPTLEEALQLTKGKILVNLDKVYDQIAPLVTHLKEKEMLDEIVFKGWMKDLNTFNKEIGVPLDSLLFMPIVSLDEHNWEDIIESYQHGDTPIAYEILFKKEEHHKKAIRMIENQNAKVWINSLWPFFNAGHDDERAVYEADATYGWLIAQGATIIQTDRPQLLIDYLKEHKLK